MTLYIKLPWHLITTVAVLVAATGPFHDAAAGEPRFSVDDMMKVEGLGAASADPQGRWFIYERIRPYDTFGDYSFRTYAMGKTGHQLWRYDPRGDRLPELLPGLDPAPHSYLQGFSPAGRYLAVMQYRFGALSLGAYDMKRETSVFFEATPAFSRAGEHNPVWISDDELIFAATPDGEWPALTSVRAYTANTLQRAWHDAWRGDVATANEVRSTSADQSDKQERGHLVRADARSGKTKIIANGLFADLRASPDGRYLAALAVSKPRPNDPGTLTTDDPRRYRLTLFDLESGASRDLAADLQFFPYSIAWSPDSRRIAAFGWAQEEIPRDGRFHVIDIKSGAVSRYEHRGLELTSERERGWLQRPERTHFLGDRLAVFARKISGAEDQSPRFTHQDLRARGLKRADWYALSADGTSQNLTAGLPGISAVPIHAGDGELTVAADDGVFRLYSDGRRRRLSPELPGRFQYLASGSFATRAGVIRPDFESEALFQVTGEGPAKIVMVDLRSGHEGGFATVEAPTATAAPVAGSFAAGAVLFRSDTGPVSRLLAASADDENAPHEIASVNKHLEGIPLGDWKIVSYMVDDPAGKLPPQTVESCVLTPPGFDRASPPPLIVEVYPDVGPSCKNGGLPVAYPNPQSPYLWAARGYAYTRLTTPRELIRTDDGPISGMDEVIEAGVDALVTEGYADPERLALFGFSQGHVSALYVAAQTSRFRAVIAMNGWADLFSHYFGPSGVYSYVYAEHFGSFGRYDSVKGSDFGIGRTPFDDPEIFTRNSPVFLAPKIVPPVMLIHSDMDSFSMSQGDLMFGALSRAGKDVRYVRYFGEGHGPSSPANIKDMWERMDAFLAETGVRP